MKVKNEKMKRSLSGLAKIRSNVEFLEDFLVLSVVSFVHAGRNVPLEQAVPMPIDSCWAW